MASEIEIVVPAPITVEVLESATNVEVFAEGGTAVLVQNGMAQQNLWVTTENPGASGPGLWIQTGVNGDPEAVTLNLIYDDGQ